MENDLRLEIPNIKKGVNIKKFEQIGCITLFGYYLKLKYNDFIEYNFYEDQEDSDYKKCDIEIKKGSVSTNGIKINSYFKITVFDHILFKTAYVADVDNFKNNMNINDKKILGNDISSFYKISDNYGNIELINHNYDVLKYCENLLKTIDELLK